KPNKPPTQPKPTNSPASPTPTTEQINQTEQKLDQAQANNLSEEELINLIKQTSETVKHSGDENLKKKKEAAEKKLSKDKLRELIREEIHQELTENGVKPEQFDPQVIRTEVLNEIGKQKLWSLINTLEQALKAGQKTKVKNHLQALQQFINSKIDYKQNAYAKQKTKVQRLLTQANQQLNSPNQTKTNFFHLAQTKLEEELKTHNQKIEEIIAEAMPEEGKID
ncbi:16101_t:CDS:2, partial [Funneliformis geosporum]